MANAPKINLGIDQLRRMMNRGGGMGGGTQPATNIGAGANHQPSALASGGATAGFKANPSRTGMPPVSAGAPAMGSAPPPPRGGQPGSVARDHSLTLASLSHLQKMGHGHPNHHAIATHARAGLAASKAAPKARGGFGSLGGAGGGVAPGAGPLSTGAAPSIPGAAAGAMGLPPLIE